MPAGGLALAYAAFGLTFRGPRQRFWQRMTATGLALGTLAVAAEPKRYRPRLRLLDVAAGVGTAAALYGIFQIGDIAARRIMPSGAGDIAAIYGLGQLRPKRELAARLGLIIAPAEELFWRGFVLRSIQRRVGRWRGAAIATGAYGGAHLVTGNPTLVGAATVAGAYWSALAAAGMPMAGLIVSHIVWDVVTFLIAPPRREPAAESLTA
ncbi:MAG: CPBP family intramembrane glutamic endopeptidase [Chloroflexota bacterium]